MVDGVWMGRGGDIHWDSGTKGTVLFCTLSGYNVIVLRKIHIEIITSCCKFGE